MRLCVALALVAMFASSTAIAADKGDDGKAKKAAKKGGKKRGKKGEEVKEGPNMDGNDPVYKEQSDEGRYTPTGTTGELKAKEIAARPKRVERFEPRPRDPFVVSGDLIFGFGHSPRPGPDVEADTPDSLLLTLVAGARYDVMPELSLGLRLPISTASMELPSRVGNEQEVALGNPELRLEYRIQPSRLTTIPIFFGLGAPLAQGDPDPNTVDGVARRQATVNLLADAAQGWREGELYGVNRIPVSIGVGVRHERRSFVFHAYDKLVAGIDTGTPLAPRDYAGTGTLVVKEASLRNVTLVGFTYDLIEKPQIWAGLDAWVVYTAIEPIEFESPATDPSPLQFVAEPRAGVRFGDLSLSLGLVFPIGGQLAEMSGIRLRADYAF